MRRALALACAAVALGGCGVGAGEADDGVRLTVTRDFGTRSLLALDAPESSGSDTVMRLLQRNADVRTRFGGNFVQSIGGLRGGRTDGRPVDWFFYVNGIESDEGAAAVDLNGGDRVWWDHHDWGATLHIPAVVGAFPEPFVHGTEGKRLPVRVECADPQSAACEAVSDRLIALGVPAGRSALGRSAADESLRILVGPWRALRGREAEADRLQHGPAASGVFARFDETGGRASRCSTSAGAPRGRWARGPASWPRRAWRPASPCGS